MRKFKWRLQRVLDIKTRQEQIERSRLLQLTEKLVARRSELMMVRISLRNLLNDISSRTAAERLNSQQIFLKNCAATDNRINELLGTISQLEKKQQEKIDEVMKLRKFKEGLEKLHQKAEKEHIDEQNKLEQKQQDENTTMRFATQAIAAR